MISCLHLCSLLAGSSVWVSHLSAAIWLCALVGRASLQTMRIAERTTLLLLHSRPQNLRFSWSRGRRNLVNDILRRLALGTRMLPLMRLFHARTSDANPFSGLSKSFSAFKLVAKIPCHEDQGFHIPARRHLPSP